MSIEAYEWRGRTLFGSDDEKIGEVSEIYLDTETGQPEWATVNTGFFGTKTSFVPITAASPKGGDVYVDATKDEVKDAPRIDPDGELSPEEERALWAHYGRDYAPPPAARKTEGEDTSGPTTDDAMTRSEEELRIGTAERESGRVRLRKFVVTEHVQQTVPVRREEVRLEREPITDGAQPGSSLASLQADHVPPALRKASRWSQPLKPICFMNVTRSYMRFSSVI